jgi:hypothetical protein
MATVLNKLDPGRRQVGMFMAISGVANSSPSVVEEVLREFAVANAGTMEPTASCSDLSDALLIAESDNNVSVMYPDKFLKWDEASQHLSQSLDQPVFSFHIHDGDLWMYVLFARGQPADRFNPIPAYWDDNISDEERRAWRGNANVVAQCWPAVKPEAIERYLVEWHLGECQPAKAYADDRFAYNDCWQLTDFMGRLGLVYPIDDHGKVHAASYRFAVKDRRIRNR